MAEARGVGLPFPDPKERCPAVLVVEDEVLIRLVIADCLRDCGFKVYDAATAADAIEVLESNEALIDLVFTDIRLPGGTNGFALAQWVRKMRPGLPVLLTSGDSKKSEAARELCENEPFFAKPYDVEVVVAGIRTTIEATSRKGEGD
jgi:DNA-binding NtrC family response regulator